MIRDFTRKKMRRVSEECGFGSPFVKRPRINRLSQEKAAQDILGSTKKKRCTGGSIAHSLQIQTTSPRAQKKKKRENQQKIVAAGDLYSVTTGVVRLS